MSSWTDDSFKREVVIFFFLFYSRYSKAEQTEVGTTVTVRARHPLGSARLRRSSRCRAKVANAAGVEGEASDKACEIADAPASCKSVEAFWFPRVKR